MRRKPPRCEAGDSQHAAGTMPRRFKSRQARASRYAAGLVRGQRRAARDSQLAAGVRGDYSPGEVSGPLERFFLDRILAVSTPSEFRQMVEIVSRCEARLQSPSRPLDMRSPSQGPCERTASTSDSGSSSEDTPTSSDSDSEPSLGGHDRTQIIRQHSGGSTSTRYQTPPIPRDYPQCPSCNKHHVGQCHAGTTLCFHCGQPGHFLRQCPQYTQRSSSEGMPGNSDSDNRLSTGIRQRKHGQPNKQQSRSNTSGLRGASGNPPPIPRNFPLCPSCSKHHEGECRVGSNVCFKCGQGDHYVRQCPLKSSEGVPNGGTHTSSGASSIQNP